MTENGREAIAYNAREERSESTNGNRDLSRPRSGRLRIFGCDWSTRFLRGSVISSVSCVVISSCFTIFFNASFLFL